MADYDVFGVLSLLLAAGGAAYLLRAHVLGRAAPQGEPDGDASEDAEEPTERASPTIPPKLRPASDPPPARRPGSGHPDRWYRDDLAEAKNAEAAKAKEAATKAIAPLLGKDTLPSSPSTVEPGRKGEAASPAAPASSPSPGPVGGSAASAGSAGSAGPAGSTLPKSSRNPPAAKITMVGQPPHATPAKGTAKPTPDTNPTAKDPGKDKPPPSSREVAKVPEKKGASPAPSTTKPKVATAAASPTPPPSVSPASASPSSRGAPAKASAPSTATATATATAATTTTAKAGPSSTGAPAKAKAKNTSTPETPSAKKRAELDEVPRIEVEEDEDVEPTRVGKMRRQIQPPVEKIPFDEGADKDAGKATSVIEVYAIAQTDPGKRRKQNEDSYLMLDKHGLYVVADGMGGHRGGQFASKLAVKTIGEAFESGTFEAAPHPDLPLPASELARAIQMANASILEEATRRPELKGMGTTLCAVRFTADRQRMYLGHVGDSRCYRVRDGVMKQITTDHTMADYGVAGPEGAHLSRALGVWPTVPIDLIMVEPKIGDLYLLCSDGLTKMLADGTIATQLLHEENPKAAIERLVFFANAHGGKDNITIILMRIVEPGWKPPEPPAEGS